jgi:predicted AAA+ superfamily ATPase
MHKLQQFSQRPLTKFSQWAMFILMDPRFSAHNAHLEDPDHFIDLDPQLRRLKHLPFVHTPSLLNQLPMQTPGIYTITGGRQIGKTTLLKQWMAKLLAEKIAPASVVFFSGELIDDYHALLHLLQTQLQSMQINQQNYIIIDEITYIRDWDKAIKYAADAGWLDDIILILTGSDAMLIQEARVRFPGRRGKASIVNFHLYPLSFYECMALKHPDITSTPPITLLFEEWNAYLLHGGYLTAINDIATHGQILEATLSTYSDWIRGDMLRRGKQEHYLREILGVIIKRYTSQITWNNLSQDLSIDHPKTVADYVALLESMDAVFVQAALLEDKLVGAPKKARKIIFCDPFIFHAINAWINPMKNPYQHQMMPLLTDANWCAKLVEAAAIAHYHRYFPTYYIKSEGEIDIAYIAQKRFYPVEIKWTNQLRSNDLKQILKYSNSKILTKNKTAGSIHDVKTEPLPLALWRLESAHLTPQLEP